MSRFIPIELHHASRLLNHGPTVLITSFDEQSQRRKHYGCSLVNAGGV